MCAKFDEECKSTCKRSTQIHKIATEIHRETPITSCHMPPPTRFPPPPRGIWGLVKCTFRTQHSHPHSQIIRICERSITEIEQTWWLESTSMRLNLPSILKHPASSHILKWAQSHPYIWAQCGFICCSHVPNTCAYKTKLDPT